MSIGNLVAGGSGKTPAVAAIATLLRGMGERPAILSRGYARRERPAGVTIVSDGERVLEPASRSGDEPQMLARMLPDVPVLVSPDRYEAGRVAIDRFASTVLLLDDGFQHVRLARDIDLLMVSRPDLDEQVLPWGALREPISSGRAADALLVSGAPADAGSLSSTLHVSLTFMVRRYHEAPRKATPFGAALDLPAGSRVVGVAGIARPHRFFASLREQGWEVVRELTFPDHHWYTAHDIARVAAAASESQATIVVTTGKDAVRLDGLVTVVPWAYLPMRVEIEPPGAFASWLADRLAACRRAGAHGERGTPSGGESPRE